MKTRTDFPRKIVEWPDVRITMADGVELSARIWLPEDAVENPVPAILEHLPYRKRDGTIARDELTHPYFAGHGYACIRVDMRGNGDSGGLMSDEYERQEWDDAIAVMNWVRAQPWSTGDWGMMGISWGGFNGLQVAAMRPEGLGAVISLCSTTDRYADDIHYKGGCMLGENLGWAAQMLSYSSRPPDPAVVGEDWREMWLERLETQPFLLETWLAHQRRDAYWAHGSVCEDWEAIKVPVLAVGGWHDGYRNTPAALVRGATAPVKAIVGPWIHKYPHFAGPEPRIGFLQEALRWWDRWLKGVETGVEDDPAQRLYLMDAVRPERWVDARPGRWIAVDAPAPEQSLHLNGDGLGDVAGPFERIIEPNLQVGLGAGEFFPFAFGPELPGDQSADDAMSVCFDHTLSADTAIVGAARVDLTVIPGADTQQLAVRLCDVWPNGQSTLISHGFLNLAQAGSWSTPEPLVAGTPLDVSVVLDQCAYRLPKGHRLRVAVSSSYWPFIWAAPKLAPMTLTGGVLHVPMLDFGRDMHAVGFPAPEGATPWKATVLRKPAMARDVIVDEATGQRVLRIVTDNGLERDAVHGLETGSICTEEWVLSDNLGDLCGTYAWESEMRRGDWSVRTACEASLRASATHWFPRAELRAFEGDRLVFAKRFSTDIPRDLM